MKTVFVMETDFESATLSLIFRPENTQLCYSLFAFDGLDRSG